MIFGPFQKCCHQNIYLKIIYINGIWYLIMSWYVNKKQNKKKNKPQSKPTKSLNFFFFFGGSADQKKNQDHSDHS